MYRRVLLAFALLGWSVPGRTAETLRVACVGDTRTGISQTGYASELAAQIGRRYDVRDFGRAGATLAAGLPDSLATSSEIGLLRSFAPHVIILHSGFADADPELWRRNRDAFVPSTAHILASLRRQTPPPQLFVALPDPAALDPSDARRRGLESGVLPLLRQAARESRVPVVDLAGTANAPDFVAEAVATVVGDPLERRGSWRVVFTNTKVDPETPPTYAIDGRLETFWQTDSSRRARRHPHELRVDVGHQMEATGFRYVPRQDGGVDGRVAQFELRLSLDGRHWGKPVALGRSLDTPRATWIRFPKAIRARYFRFRSKSEVTGGRSTSAAETSLVGALIGLRP